MEPVKLEASRRDPGGKNAARRLRAEERIPAVAYGRSLASTALSVSPKELTKILKSEAGRNAFIELDIDGKEKVLSVLADYQYHPVNRSLIHADFLQVDKDQKVDVDVKLELTGKPKGVVLGGVLQQVFRTVPLRCLPGNIPLKVTHDVSELDIDGTVKIQDLDLGEGVESRFAGSRTVALLIAKKKRGGEEEGEGEEEKKEEAAAK